MPENYKYYVISDLHIAEGKLSDGTYLGTENFFADREFSNFIKHITEQDKESEKHLIINGDFVDFIRQTKVPEEDFEIDAWKDELHKLNIDLGTLPHELDEKEKDYGLKSNDFKSVWKLYMAIEGHKEFFDALASWIKEGNYLTILAGNHDQEWIWDLVQEYFKFRIIELSGCGKSFVDDKIRFEDDFITLHDKIWVEHGHNFEFSTKFEEELILNPQEDPRKQQLRWPFGNFFNRYFINKVELVFPYVNNLKVSQALIQSIFKEDTSAVLKILKNYSLYLIYIVSKNFKKLLLSIFIMFVVSVLPLLISGYLLYDHLVNSVSQIPKFSNTIMNILKVISPLLLRYLSKWILSSLGLSDKPIFQSGAEKIARLNTDRQTKIEYLVLGHNHKPEKKILKQKNGNSLTYLNSGSWTGSYEMKFKKVQLGAVYSMVHLEVKGNKVIKDEILKWDEPSQLLLPVVSFSLK